MANPARDGGGRAGQGRIRAADGGDFPRVPPGAEGRRPHDPDVHPQVAGCLGDADPLAHRIRLDHHRLAFRSSPKARTPCTRKTSPPPPARSSSACRKRDTVRIGAPARVAGSSAGRAWRRDSMRAVQAGAGRFRAAQAEPGRSRWWPATAGRCRCCPSHWPVLDGDAPVSPVRALTEASAVVAQAQVQPTSPAARLSVSGIWTAETALAVTDLRYLGAATNSPSPKR